ncbi:membrane protein [Pilimelia anulata]|uniref:Membrane protein n=1 Tax=Pilimelia anulata TaxID=53371 RepID=A0A8J3B234_9ACTN|nr:glycosyltransferase 87 family protein [Pilimelia anulata]GGJ87917.1 membrane protein [Pilimelia anulata]
MNLRRAVVDLPGRSDGFVRGLSEAIGGPPGSHTAGADSPGGPWRGRFWTASRVVLALACLTLVLHWVQKSPCMDGAWTDNIQYKRYCYTDVLALYFAEGLDQGRIPYVDHPVEYPVLTGAFMGLLGLPIHRLGAGDPAINQGMWFYQANALVLGVLAVAAVGMLLALRRRRPWDAALFALAPAMFISATVNWDLLSIFFAVGGLLAWARSRPVLAGVLLGLGTAAKLWPGFLLVAIALLALRARRLGPAAAAGAAAVLTWLAVNLPVMWQHYDNWSRFLTLNRERAVDWGTLWYIGDHFPRGGGKYGLALFQDLARDIPRLNLVTYVLIALAWLAIGLLVLRAPEPPRLGQVAFLVVAAFLIFNKVWSQQFVLWLVPLVVLARPRWWAFLAWQAAELCYFAAFYGELMGAGGKQVFPEGVFVLASVLRFGTVVLLCGLIVRDVLRPAGDVVRGTYGGDPDAGPLAPRPVPEVSSPPVPVPA